MIVLFLHYVGEVDIFSMNVQNVSSCLQQCKNYKNRMCFSRVVITNVQLTFLSHPVDLSSKRTESVGLCVRV